MRLAFIDLVFRWPPPGGAPADLYYTISGLQALGHEVRLFIPTERHGLENPFLTVDDLGALPFPCTPLEFNWREKNPKIVADTFRHAVDAWKPDIVFQCFGFFYKPYVSEALSHYPQIARYYAYEPFCPMNYRRFVNRANCPNNFLRTPNECRRCALSEFWNALRLRSADDYVEEYERTRAYSPAYYKTLMKTVRNYSAVIVYNRYTKGLLEGINDRVHVIGGGVHLEDFNYVPLPEAGTGQKTIILMTGRATDYSKGIETLDQAGRLLWAERQDFEIWCTSDHFDIAQPWLKPLGWHDFQGMARIYQQADICVAPSLWQEPFGLVAVEAMALGRPAIVARVGGLQEIVAEGETGHIYEPGDIQGLAAKLRPLLDDPALRKRMGDAGRKRVAERYEWSQVIQRHYPPLLDEVMR